MSASKKIFVYHYNEDIGKNFVNFLVEAEGFDATYIQLNREMPRGFVANQVAEKKPNLVYLALNFGGGIRTEKGYERLNEGLEELLRIREKSDVPVIMVTGGGTAYKEEAMERGATEYVTLPFKNLQELIELTNKYTMSYQPQS